MNSYVGMTMVKKKRNKMIISKKNRNKMIISIDKAYTSHITSQHKSSDNLRQ